MQSHVPCSDKLKRLCARLHTPKRCGATKARPRWPLPMTSMPKWPLLAHRAQFAKFLVNWATGCSPRGYPVYAQDNSQTPAEHQVPEPLAQQGTSVLSTPREKRATRARGVGRYYRPTMLIIIVKCGGRLKDKSGKDAPIK